MAHTILVVDDEADVRAFLTAILAKEGYETVTAANGREALEIVRHTPPDLVILDLQMPQQTGTDFYRRLSQDRELRTIPIIVVSGLAGRHLAVSKPFAVFDKPIDPDKVAKIDGAQSRKVSEQIFAEEMAKTTDEEFSKKELFGKFKPKGQMPLELLVFQSVLGPIGLPATEAVYPGVATTEGKPLNAMNDYVIRMSADELPPTDVFWSLTLYDLNNGFFIPNDQKKYSVGENAGMKLNEDGGIEVYVAAEKPEGVPEENWLPINRKDEDMDIVLRVYVADLEKMKTWSAPKAEKLAAGAN